MRPDHRLTRPPRWVYHGELLQRKEPMRALIAIPVYNEQRHLPRVLAAGARLVGVNNRDLRTFTTDLEHTLRLRREIPADRVLVGESGIRTRADVERLEAAGVQAMLVGESLMRQADIGAAVDALLGR